LTRENVVITNLENIFLQCMGVLLFPFPFFPKLRVKP